MVKLIGPPSSATRNQPISAELRKVLEGAAEAAGIDLINIVSGGQPAKGQGTRRRGSTRHDNGRAADIQLISNGRVLTFSDEKADPRIEMFVTESAALGANGIGAGVGYMGNKTIHVGFGQTTQDHREIVWGAREISATAPHWLRMAAEKGWRSARTGVLAQMQGQTPTADKYFVVARDGLALHSGPGSHFETKAKIDPGTEVHVSGFDGESAEWARISLMDDGLIDGHVLAPYLKLFDTESDDNASEFDFEEDDSSRENRDTVLSESSSDAFRPPLIETLAQPPKRLDFGQEVVDLCAGLTFSNASDILQSLHGAKSFFTWFNDTFKGDAALKSRYPSPDSQVKRDRFEAFWNSIETIFSKKEINAIQFCALMAVSLRETGGDLSAYPEKMNGMKSAHPGLAYAFDKIPGLKTSYNHKPNRTALNLFKDADFVSAHRSRAGAQLVLGHKGGIDGRWGGETWPNDVQAFVDESKNGFIMQADFYKFRGRGVIQTTWRSAYEQLIEWIISADAASNSKLSSLATQWTEGAGNRKGKAKLDFIATVSSNEDWDNAFEETITLAKGVALDSLGKGDYLNSFAVRAETLDGDKKDKGSLLNFASHINGGNYPAEVAPMIKSLMCGLAETHGLAEYARIPRLLEIPEEMEASGVV